MQVRYSQKLAAVAVLIFLPAPAMAQAVVSGELGINSASVFRGVTDTNRPVLDVTVALEAPWHGLDFTAGGWLAVEPKAYRAADDLSLLGDAARAGVTQGSFWLDATRGVGALSATVGATNYLYPALADLAATYNTVELYGSLSLDVPLAPALTLYQDVARIRGAYLEGTVAQPLLSSDHGELAVGAAAGWSLGQAMPDDADSAEVGYFGGNGLTHVELFASSSRSVGALALGAHAHLVLARDAYTRVVAPDRERAAKLWLGISVGWSSATGRAAEDAVQS